MRWRRLLASSSKAWRMERGRDQWADRAAKEGLRSRAAFKLLEINQRFGNFLKKGAFVVDLGAAPGGFSVVTAGAVGVDKHNARRWNFASDLAEEEPPLARSLSGQQPRRRHGRLVCVDVQEMDDVPGARFIHGDACIPDTQRAVVRALGGEADVVLSDMAPRTVSDPATSHIRSVELARGALTAARGVLRNGGTMVCKVFAGKDEPEFRKEMRDCFLEVKAFTPKACKKRSVEHYLVGKGFVLDQLRRRVDGLLEKEGDDEEEEAFKSDVILLREDIKFGTNHSSKG